MMQAKQAATCRSCQAELLISRHKAWVQQSEQISHQEQPISYRKPTISSEQNGTG